MKITMVNKYGNCFKVCTTQKEIDTHEKLGFKVYEEPKVEKKVETKSKSEKRDTTKNTFTKKAVKKNEK